MKIRVEAESILRDSITGVGYYTKSLIESLKAADNINVDSFTLPTKTTKNSFKVTTISGLPRRLYVKLNQFGLAPSFDTKLAPVDLTIFPDFALWPTRKSKINAVVIHDLTFLKYPEYMRVRSIGPIKLPVTTWYLSSVTKNALRKSNLIITVSNNTKDELVSTFGVAAEKIITTEIPPSNEFIAQKNTAIAKRDLLKKYSIPTEKYILSVGTIEPRKNQVATLRAYLQLPDNIRSSHSLVFAGGAGWSSDVFLNEFKKAKLSGENVVLTGYFDQNDSYGLYDNASLFTSASYYEGFGMPVLEAATTQTPTVLSDIPVFREITNDKSIYIEPSDTEAYSEALRIVLTDSAMRKKNIVAGSINIRRYSWEENSKRIIAAANRILSQE